MVTPRSNRAGNSSPCYFSIVPPIYDTVALDHFSLETPTIISPAVFSPNETIAHPQHPLLAHREVPSSPTTASPTTMSSNSSFLSRQTTAANGSSPSRPRSIAGPSGLHVTRGDSSSSASSSSSVTSNSSTPEIARCSRCQRTQSIDLQTGKSNMIQYGLNQYYCSRCASIVGLINR